jgi:hypothetical protein
MGQKAAGAGQSKVVGLPKHNGTSKLFGPNPFISSLVNRRAPEF